MRPVQSVMNSNNPESAAACPKCKSAGVQRRIVVQDLRSQYVEIEAKCPNCSDIWHEFYQKGVLVSCRGPKPKPEPEREPIHDVKLCPICGTFADSKTGFPMLFDLIEKRLRYYAHHDCYTKAAAKHGSLPPMPYAPKLGEAA